MDSGCVICYGSHASSDCPERGEQHCPDCHALILEVVDHTSVCAQKGWVFKKYANLYAKPLKERLIISTSSPFRYLKNACWQKPEDQLELYSPGNGAFIQFKSSHDISLSTTRFEPIRIVVVVKQKEGNAETFAEKLLLYTTQESIIAAFALDNRFDRNATEASKRDVSLYLAVSSEDRPVFTLNVFPSKRPARSYTLRFDENDKMFIIPSAAKLDGTSASNDAYQHDDAVYPQLMTTNENNQLVRSNDIGSHEVGNVARATMTGVDRFDNCFECHAKISCANEHVPKCGAKNWFLSKLANVYVKNPVARCVISFKSPPKVCIKSIMVLSHSFLLSFCHHFVDSVVIYI